MINEGIKKSILYVLHDTSKVIALVYSYCALDPHRNTYTGTHTQELVHNYDQLHINLKVQEV